MNNRALNLAPWSLAICTFVAGSLIAGPLQAASYRFDGDKRNVIHWLSSAPMEKIKGTAGVVTGVLKLDPRALKSLKVEVKSEVASMKSGNPMRDEHLRSPGWLDAKRYPHLEFKLSEVVSVKRRKGAATITAEGMFTCHGVSRPLRVRAELKWNKRLVKITTAFSIALKDYGVKGSQGVVGNKVGRTIQINATLYARR